MNNSLVLFNQKMVLELKEKLESIFERHNTFKQINLPTTRVGTISTFRYETSFEYDCVTYTIIQEVNEVYGEYKYAIAYYENGKYRNRNIRHLMKIYDVIKSYAII